MNRSGYQSRGRLEGVTAVSPSCWRALKKPMGLLAHRGFSAMIVCVAVIWLGVPGRRLQAVLRGEAEGDFLNWLTSRWQLSLKTHRENLTRYVLLSDIAIYEQPAWPRLPTDQYLTVLYTFFRID